MAKDNQRQNSLNLRVKVEGSSKKLEIFFCPVGARLLETLTELIKRLLPVRKSKVR